MEKAAYYLPLTIVLIEGHFFALFVPASPFFNFRLENTAEIFKNEEDKTVYFALKDELSEVRFFPVKFLQKTFEKERFYDKKLIGDAEAVKVNG